jgi:hypothetical protein
MAARRHWLARIASDASSPGTHATIAGSHGPRVGLWLGGKWAGA